MTNAYAQRGQNYLYVSESRAPSPWISSRRFQCKSSLRTHPGCCGRTVGCSWQHRALSTPTTSSNCPRTQLHQALFIKKKKNSVKLPQGVLLSRYLATKISDASYVITKSRWSCKTTLEESFVHKCWHHPKRTHWCGGNRHGSKAKVVAWEISFKIQWTWKGS